MGKKKEKTLAEVMPDPVERLTLEVSNLNAKVYEITEELKTAIGMNASDIQKLTGRIEAAVEIIEKVHRENQEALEAHAKTREMIALQSIATSVEGIHQIKKAYADKMNGKEAAREQVKRDNAGHMDKPKTAGLGASLPAVADIRSALEGRGVNTSLIAISVDKGLAIITPIKFLGDLWGPINEAVREMGGGWIRDGKQSRWEIKGAAA